MLAANFYDEDGRLTPPDKMNLLEKMEWKAIRTKLNLTLREFADIIGVRDPRTVRRYETMEHVPPQVAKVARGAAANGQ